MKHVRPLSSFLATITLLLSGLNAQPSSSLIKQQLHKELTRYLVYAKPDHTCRCNNCEHTYSGRLSVRNIQHAMRVYEVMGQQKRIEVIRVWGSASADQSSPFETRTTQVFFIADIKEMPDQLVLVSLKWKKNDCMKYVELTGEEVEADLRRLERLSAYEAKPETYFRKPPPSYDEYGLEESDEIPTEEVLETNMIQVETVSPENGDLLKTPSSAVVASKVEEPAMPQISIAPAPSLTLDAELKAPQAKKRASKAGATPSQQLSGTITNSTENRYKDAVIKISFFSKTETQLSQHTHVLYEYLEPGEAQDFSYPVDAPEATAHYEMEIVEAVLIDE
ncbi:MAG: hypothetical protein AAGI38_16980 [Bacteroidota bacterium]